MRTDKQYYKIFGVIFFGEKRLDPQTAPWNQVIESFVLRDVVEAFAAQNPQHPLGAVFDPLLARDDQELKTRVVGDAYQIRYSDQLSQRARQVLLEVFGSWLMQRFKHLPRKEIEAMMLSELPNLSPAEIEYGRTIMQLGEDIGRADGLNEAILLLLTARFQRVPATLRRRIHLLPETARTLLTEADDITSLNALKQWLARHNLDR